jgi:hypothetical protein
MPKSESHEQFYSTVHSMLEGVAGLTPERRDEKLRQLITNYGPQLNGCLIRKYRISEDDAAEVVQQFLLTRLLVPLPEQNVAGQFLAAKRIEPQLRFRNYLRRALYNFYIDQRRRKQLPVVQVDCLEGAADKVAENPDEDIREDITWANHLLNQACNAVQQECYLRDQVHVWRVFRERILNPIETGMPAVSYVNLCAEGLASSPKQVANLLETAIRKFNRVLKDLVAAYLPCDEESLQQSVEQELDELRRALATPHAVRLAAFADYSAGSAADVSTDRKQLLEVSEEVASLWTEADLADFWKSLLTRQPDQIMAEITGTASVPCAEQFSPEQTTFLQLMSEPEPALDILIRIKDAAKQSAVQRQTGRNHATKSTNVFPPNVTMLIYGLSIAIARLRWNQRISSDPDSRFIPRVCHLLEFPWIDPRSRQILQEWLATIGS